LIWVNAVKEIMRQAGRKSLKKSVGEGFGKKCRSREGSLEKRKKLQSGPMSEEGIIERIGSTVREPLDRENYPRKPSGLERTKVSEISIVNTGSRGSGASVEREKMRPARKASDKKQFAPMWSILSQPT